MVSSCRNLRRKPNAPLTVPLSPLFSRDKCRDWGAKVSRSSTPWTSTVYCNKPVTPVISFKEEEAEKENLAALDGEIHEARIRKNSHGIGRLTRQGFVYGSLSDTVSM
eukprot:g64029.t1